MVKAMRELPNIVVTGTPGVGKTSHCELLASNTALRHVSVNQVVKDKECHDGWDDERKCWIVDDDKVRRHSCISAVRRWRAAMLIWGVLARWEKSFSISSRKTYSGADV